MRLCKLFIAGYLLVISVAHADIYPNNLNDKQKEQIQEQKITKVAKELQDVLATKMLEQMFEGQKPNKLFGGGSAETTYQSLLNEERAKNLDLGLVEQINQQMQAKTKSKGRRNERVKKH
jgi:Rod binding domain-containing protein